MTKLSVNVNKIATLRNARGGSNPNVLQVALDCERFGADGITIHPRPDERHITRQDVFDLSRNVRKELNIEGYPDNRFLGLVKEAHPTQATLVPDPPDVLTSNAGWDTIAHQELLKDVIAAIKSWGVRVSIFIEPKNEMIHSAVSTGTDRIELYTEEYANKYTDNQENAIVEYKSTALLAQEFGLGVNAGHDLDLNNLRYLKEHIPFIEEVSIGHALVCDALYFGLENTIQMYKRRLTSYD